MMQSSIGTEHTYSIEDDQTASEAVLEAVAEQVDADILDLSVPLYDAVDPDALDAFYRTSAESGDATPSRVTFSYYEYEVEVSGDGEVVLRS